MAENEGAKFWLSVLTELKNRGVEDILIACVDGLKGSPEAIGAVYPDTHVQLCVVHMVRNSMRFVSWKDYKRVAAQLKTIYQAPTEQQALEALDQFEADWKDKYPVIAEQCDVIGSISSRCLITQMTSVESFIRPMPLSPSIVS